MAYQIKIKKPFFFGWTSYDAVVAHATELLGATSRLVLEFKDGAKLAIPGIEKRVVFVYPDK